jgi:hypothetical protein
MSRASRTRTSSNELHHLYTQTQNHRITKTKTTLAQLIPSSLSTQGTIFQHQLTTDKVHNATQRRIVDSSRKSIFHP